MDTLTASDICIDCNLCCSSNLGIRIYPDEYEGLKNDLLNVIQLREDDAPWNAYMDLSLNELNPGTCPQLGEDGKCGIYDKRPHVCRSFKCGVLNQYEQREIDYDEVQELISQVKEGDKHLWNTRFMTNTTTYKKDDMSPKSHFTIENFLTPQECLHIANILTRDESKILSIPKTRNEDLSSYEGLTAQHTVYNLLTHPDIRPLNIPNRLFNLDLFKPTKDEWYSDLWIQCWGNVLHQGENLGTHAHADEDIPLTEQNPLYAMSIYLDGTDPSYTHWNGNPMRNERGTLHVAGMLTPHEVKTNVHTKPRISMAMDVYWKEDSTLKHEHKRFLHARRPIHLSKNYEIEEILHESEFEGMRITVRKTDQHTKLYLCFGDNTWFIQTLLVNNDPIALHYPYVQQLCAITDKVKDPKSILVLGLGGGIMPTWLNANTKCTDIDVVDINPELESIARTHFHMPESINVIIDDAFEWIHTDNAKTYDIIILDLVLDKTEFLYPNEFYEGLQNKLTPDGYVAINYLAHKDTPHHAAHHEQLRKIFTSVQNVGNHPYKNCITYCSK